MSAFPFDVRGKVPPGPDAGAVEAIKVVRAAGSGFLLITREHGSELDVWLETLNDVEATLATLRVEWPSEG